MCMCACLRIPSADDWSRCCCPVERTDPAAAGAEGPPLCARQAQPVCGYRRLSGHHRRLEGRLQRPEEARLRRVLQVRDAYAFL